MAKKDDSLFSKKDKKKMSRKKYKTRYNRRRLYRRIYRVPRTYIAPTPSVLVPQDSGYAPPPSPSPSYGLPSLKSVISKVGPPLLAAGAYALYRRVRGPRRDDRLPIYSSPRTPPPPSSASLFWKASDKIRRIREFWNMRNAIADVEMHTPKSVNRQLFREKDEL